MSRASSIAYHQVAEHLGAIRWLQVTALIAIWAGAQAVVNTCHWPLPGSVVGLLLVWLLLERRVVPAAWIETGADNLLDHLMLFFVPAMLGLIDHPELLSSLGARLLAAVLIGTITVMCGTALVVETGFRLLAAHNAPSR